jgi:hypothetical protein
MHRNEFGLGFATDGVEAATRGNGDFGISPCGQTRCQAFEIAHFSRNDHGDVINVMLPVSITAGMLFFGQPARPWDRARRRLIAVARIRSKPSAKINIISTAALHTPLPLGVKPGQPLIGPMSPLARRVGRGVGEASSGEIL